MKIFILFILLLIENSKILGQSAERWFNDESIESTVLLEKEQSGQLITHGTGFIILPYKSSDQIIVTCAHLLKNSSIYVTLEINEKFRRRFRGLPKIEQDEILKVLKTGRSLLWNTHENFMRIKVDLVKDSTLFLHPKGLDIGGFKINLPGNISFRDSTYKVVSARMIGKSRLSDKVNIKLGDDIYFIGFPFGIGSPKLIPSQSNFTTSSPKHLIRRGIIAWYNDDYDEFLLDAMSFGGNSGSPLFKVPHEGGKPAYYLIGIVIGHLGDSTTNTNFGLARCLSVNEINKVLELADK